MNRISKFYSIMFLGVYKNMNIKYLILYMSVFVCNSMNTSQVQSAKHSGPVIADMRQAILTNNIAAVLQAYESVPASSRHIFCTKDECNNYPIDYAITMGNVAILSFLLQNFGNPYHPTMYNKQLKQLTRCPEQMRIEQLHRLQTRTAQNGVGSMYDRITRILQSHHTTQTNIIASNTTNIVNDPFENNTTQKDSWQPLTFENPFRIP